MKQPSPLIVSIIFAIILVFLACHVKGQPSAPPVKGTAAWNESIYQMGRKTAMAATPTPDVLIVVVPKVTNSCTLLVTNNTVTITNYQSYVDGKLVSNFWTYTFAPPFNYFWSSNSAGPYSNAGFVMQGNTNPMETFQFVNGKRFFYAKLAGNVTN
jgi:hypothetical protein